MPQEVRRDCPCRFPPLPILDSLVNPAAPPENSAPGIVEVANGNYLNRAPPAITSTVRLTAPLPALLTARNCHQNCAMLLLPRRSRSALSSSAVFPIGKPTEPPKPLDQRTSFRRTSASESSAGGVALKLNGPEPRRWRAGSLAENFRCDASGHWKTSVQTAANTLVVPKTNRIEKKKKKSTALPGSTE